MVELTFKYNVDIDDVFKLEVFKIVILLVLTFTVLTFDVLAMRVELTVK